MEGSGSGLGRVIFLCLAKLSLAAFEPAVLVNYLVLDDSKSFRFASKPQPVFSGFRVTGTKPEPEPGI